ncbi:RNA methyltransferase substrate-binding domain-containing protein, partial [Deinococcus sp. GbtcB9]|uniref:RNA methyltransferase substrate-binding domain-containing protein n=1 Tax=Deinococcus sp. GbtcB9 TaxID=2824754 RepID=UPI0027387317
LYGRNPVLEALQDGRESEVLVARGVEEAFVAELKATGVRMKFAPRIVLDQLAGTTQHQGVLAGVEDLEWASVDDILDLA